MGRPYGWAGLFGAGREPEAPAPAVRMLPSSRALLDVISERLRQVQGEGFHAFDDDFSTGGELARAALNYAAAAAVTVALAAKSYDTKPPLRGWGPAVDWPWDLAKWKPGAPRRMLVKAAALLLAEIERLDRLEAK